MAAESEDVSDGSLGRTRSVVLKNGFRAVIAEDAILGGEHVRLKGGHATPRPLVDKPPVAPKRNHLPPSVHVDSVGVCGVDAWSEFLYDATSGLERLYEPRVLKRSPDVEVVQTVLVDGSTRLPVVVKRYCEQRRRGWRRWVSSSLAGSDFRAMAKLRAQGVSVPRPLAFVGSRGSSAYSWLITEFVDGLVELEQVVLSLLPQLPPGGVRTAKASITSAVVDLYVSFDRCGLHHRDLKASNIMLRRWDGRAGGPEAWIVDVEGFRNGRTFAESKRRQRLVRLAASLQEYSGVTSSDHARFLREYARRCDWAVGQWRSVFRTVSLAAQRYARRSTSRKKHKIDGYGG